MAIAHISHLVSQHNPVPTLPTTTSPIHHLQPPSSFSSTAHSPPKIHQVIEIPLSTNSPTNSIPTALQNASKPDMSSLLVVLDFDGTITQEDSLDTLTRFAAHYTAAKEPAVSESSLLDDWQASVIQPYLADLAKFEDEYSPLKKDRATWDEEEKYLESLRTVEEKSVKRVEASPIFEGFGDDDYRRFGREAAGRVEPARDTSDVGAKRSGSLPTVSLRPGFNDFLLAASQRQWKLGLVSVNWSRHFIEGVLGVNDSKDVRGEHSRMSLNEGETKAVDQRKENQVISNAGLSGLGIELTLLANHITPEPRINGPAGWDKPLTAAGDKAKAFDQLREGLKHTGPVVYMGDSKTDLLCLRDADLGIIITGDPEQSSLLAALHRLGSQVPHVHEDILPVTKYTWARDFTEILESKILSKLAGEGV